MLPVLQVLEGGQPLAVNQIREQTAKRLHLSDEDLSELTPSGKKTLIQDRIAWTLTYLKQASVIDRPKRGVYKINSRGRDILSHEPNRVDNSTLEQFPEFQDFLSRSNKATVDRPPGDRRKGDDLADSRNTPEESLEAAYQRLRGAIEADLLKQVREAPPEFFERLVVELLVKMGYGGSLRDAGKAVGKSGDGGIDGIIKEDRLGLDVIHIQAKRWNGERTVGRPEIQGFAGSLDGVRAKKGIFLTTASFSAEARDYVGRIDKRIVLIDGDELSTLMYEYGIGVSRTAEYEVKHIDADYFGEG